MEKPEKRQCNFFRLSNIKRVVAFLANKILQRKEETQEIYKNKVHSLGKYEKEDII